MIKFLHGACYYTGHFVSRNWGHSEETKKKIGLANAISNKGRKHSKEWIAKEVHPILANIVCQEQVVGKLR